MSGLPYVVVVGGANLDVIARPDEPAVTASSNPGRVGLTAGGVGRNVAANLARLGTPAVLVAAVGQDDRADLVLAATAQAGVDVSHVRRVPGATGSYVALLDHEGELLSAVSDMPAVLAPHDLDRDLIAGAALVVLDGNLTADTLAAAWDAAARRPVVLDPVSVPKAARVGDVAVGRRLFLLSAGAAELAAVGSVDAQLTWERRGPSGSVLTTPEEQVLLAAPAVDVVDVTGAGDAMLAAFCHAWLGGADPAEAAAYGHAAAALTVASAHTVRPDLTPELVRSLM